jgi:hypothetical protein
MNDLNESTAPAGTYIPGYARQKVLLIVFGLVLCVIALAQLETPLRLVIFGERTRAEATDVIKSKAGLPDLVLKSDAQIRDHSEARDRSYVFWNEFRFRTSDGRVVTVRAPVGSELKPLYPLLDEDGLPTTDLVCYEAGNPNVVVFPLIISTWFAPGMMLLVGLLATLIGGFLLYWSNKPIVLPHLPSGKSDDSES